MKKLVAFGVFALVLSLGTASAQIGQVGVGIAGVGELPIGNFADNVGIGLGGLGDIEAGMYPGLAVTARSGYLYHFQKHDLSYYHQIPIMGGLKYSVPTTPIYVAGEMGAVLVRRDFTSTTLTPAHVDNSTTFGWDAGLGSDVGPVDLRLTFNVLNASDMTNSMTVGLSIGFNIWST